MSRHDPWGDGLPSWAIVTPERAAHVSRVVTLLWEWATAMQLPDEETLRWRKAGWLHDALRDADEPTLRRLSGDNASPLALLHGPAAARHAADLGEDDHSVLDAVRWHTVGSPEWDAVGGSLFAADFLEPGRTFVLAGREDLTRRYPDNPRRVLREIVELRLAHQRQKGRADHPMTVAFLESLS